jgi:hypothetical protein
MALLSGLPRRRPGEGSELAAFGGQTREVFDSPDRGDAGSVACCVRGMILNDLAAGRSAVKAHTKARGMATGIVARFPQDCMTSNPDFEHFVRDYLWLAGKEKSRELRTRFLLLSRDWMDALMQDQPETGRRRRRSKN